MPLIVFYISDHGFGHASRNIPLIDALLADPNHRVLVKSGPPQIEYMRTVFPDHSRLVFDQYIGDVGLPLLREDMRPDIDSLRKALRTWTRDFEAIAKEEALRIAAHGTAAVIVSDISPVGFLVADVLGVRSIGISNFTWSDQYEYLLDGHLPELRTLRDAYGLCSGYLRYFPACACLGISCQMQDIGFVSRQVDERKVAEIRKRFKMPGTPLVFIGLGRSCPSLEFSAAFASHCTVLMTTGIQAGGDSSFTLPLDTPDVHNYIAASDLVITKGGWSTIAECVRGRVPMLILERPGILEDQTNTNWIMKYGIGESVALEQLRLVDRDDIERLVSLRKNYEAFSPTFEQTKSLANRILAQMEHHEESVHPR